MAPSSSSSTSAGASRLPNWPPQLTQAKVSALAASATDYALSHGVVYRPVGSPPASTHVHHAPVSLLPSPFPRHAFDLALQLQPILNELYARVALDDGFLEKVVGGNVAKVDEFQKGLWEVYKSVRSQGLEPDYHLGLFRSDYLLHSDPESSRGETAPGIRQVEFNTISSSFGPLCAKVGELHRFLLDQTEYYGASSSLQSSQLPKNTALAVLAEGLAQAHQTYVREHNVDAMGARVLFVVQEKERNAFDQRWIEYELLEKHGIRSIRRTFTSLIKDADVDDTSRRLSIRTEATPGASAHISTVYYRAGYAPTDYATREHWSLRERLERSKAVKCPTVALQLAGAKKVQQVLSEPGVVESFLPHASSEQITSLRSTWAGLYPLDDTSELGRRGLALAQDLTTAKSYVMKPQREGGGNNIYRDDIPKALQAMDERDTRSSASIKEREGYILMELIQPPTGLGNYLLRPPAGGAGANNAESSTTTVLSGASEAHHEGLTTAECRLSPDVVSELGIYGVALFKGGGEKQIVFSSPQAESQQRTTQEVSAGYLLRTKGRESDEGGVAVGFSVLDSVLLV